MCLYLQGRDPVHYLEMKQKKETFIPGIVRNNKGNVPLENTPHSHFFSYVCMKTCILVYTAVLLESPQTGNSSECWSGGRGLEPWPVACDTLLDITGPHSGWPHPITVQPSCGFWQVTCVHHDSGVIGLFSGLAPSVRPFISPPLTP